MSFHNQVTDIDIDVPFLYRYQGWIPCLNMIYGMGWAVSKGNHHLSFCLMQSSISK